MKNNQESQNIVNSIIVFVILLVLVCFALYIDPPRSKDDIQTYNLDELSFDYSKNLQISRTDSDDISFIDISLKDSKDDLNTKFIEITILNEDNSTSSLKDDLKSSYPNLKNSQIKKIIRKNAEAYQFSLNTNEEKTVNTYFKFKNKILIAKFYERYYPVNQALVPINNTIYFREYLNLINSIKIN